MKAILLSIRPEWCNLIIRGQKTLEMRRTSPKLETPFKCYVYCTKSKSKTGWLLIAPGKGWQRLDGNIIGEFTCDKIEKIVHIGTMMDINILTLDGWYKPADALLQAACLTEETAKKYLQGHNGYGWHISDLKIYDRPRPLSDFKRLRATKFGYEPVDIERPPQSWYYVEDGR